MDSALVLNSINYLAQHKLHLATFALTIFIADRFIKYWRLRQFKGPFSTGFSDLCHSWAILSLKAYLFYGEVTEKYGPIARVAPNHLVTSSPELWAHINAARSPYSRAEWYYHAVRFEPGKDNVFTEVDNKKHEKRRKQIAAGYSGKENLQIESAIDVHVKELIQLIRSKYATSDGVSRPMDLASKMQYLALDVIGDVGLGRSFGDLIADADVNDYIWFLEGGLLIGTVSLGLGISWIREVPGLWKLVKLFEKDEKGYGKMMASTRKYVQDRLLRHTDTRSDMLASFIRHGLAGDELFQEAFEQILAGFDTTASALRIIMLYTITNPRVYAKLRSEIDAAVKAGIAPPSPEVISDSKAGQLPYFGAVIREALRIHPAVVNIFSRVVPKGGDAVTVDGKSYYLPGGTRIGYAAWSLHRNNKAVYGEDAHVFRPERWFVSESDPDGKERLARMIKTNDMVFGYGRWHCLGKTVAMIEIHKVVFELLRNFDFALINPEKPWTKIDTMGLFAIKKMWVQVTERQSVEG